MYYAVRNGREPGVYNCWEDARKQVEKYPNNKHHRFTTRSEAEHYVNTGELHKIQHNKITSFFKKTQPLKENTRKIQPNLRKI